MSMSTLVHIGVVHVMNEPGLPPLFCILQEGLRTMLEFSTLNVAVYSVNHDKIWEWPEDEASVKAQCLNVVLIHPV